MFLGILPTNTLLVWLAVGVVAGVIMHLIDKRDVKGGILATIVTGILGALIGGFLSSAIFGIGITGLNVTSIIIAVAGGLVFSFIQRIITNTVDESPSNIQERNQQLEDQNEQFMRETNNYPETPAGYAYYSQVYPSSDKSEKVNPIRVQGFLEGIDYPASKSDLIKTALIHGADDDIVQAIKNLPEETYYSPTGVSEDLGKAE